VALSAARVLAGCRREYLATLGRAHKGLSVRRCASVPAQPDFAGQHDAAKALGILRKTWSKMSPRGREVARAAGLRAEVQRLIDAALEADLDDVSEVEPDKTPDEP